MANYIDGVGLSGIALWIGFGSIVATGNLMAYAIICFVKYLVKKIKGN